MPNDSPETSVILPIEPPCVCRGLAPITGHLGPDPEDFQVDEIPAYEPGGSGSHLYVRVRKRLLTTPDLIHILSKAAGVPEPSLGHAGMKDKHAVTTQWVSLPLPCRPRNEWLLPESVEILEESLHTNKLRTGHLHGNRFTLRLVELEPEDHARVQLLWTRIQAGLFNSFGEQRFGHGGSNLQRALSWLRGSFQLRGPKARFLKKLHPSVIQSEIFNRYLIARVAASLDRPLMGEVVRLKGSGSSFIIEDPEKELPRWIARDILPTGPMFGSRTFPAARGDALALEQQAMHEVCPEVEQIDRLYAEAPGTRRDLLLFLEDPALEWVDDRSVRVSFALPSGAYATQVIRELTQEPWLRISASRV